MTVTLHHEINNPLMAAFADIELLLHDVERPRPISCVKGWRIFDSRSAGSETSFSESASCERPRSKDYLHGVRMLDLEPGEAEALSIQRGVAVVHVPEEDLARIVSLLLRGSGFQVERCRSVRRAADGGRPNRSDGCRDIGGTPARPGRTRWAASLPTAEREYRVVALVAGDGAAALAAGADHAVTLPFDPETFTTEILRLLSPA